MTDQRRTFAQLMGEASKDFTSHGDFLPELVRLQSEALAQQRAYRGGDASRDDELARRLAFAAHMLVARWPQVRDELRLPAHLSPADRHTVATEVSRLSELQGRLQSRFATHVLVAALTSLTLALTGVELSEENLLDVLSSQ